MPIANICHSGNAGDIIYAMPTFKTFGKVNLFLIKSQQTSIQIFEALIPLLKSQDYINDVEYFNGQRIDFDFDRFREIGGVSNNSLPITFMNLYQRYFNLSNPWLTVEQNTLSDIVISRTTRYPGVLDYRKALSKFRDKCIFVGLDDEYENFVKNYGFLRFAPTKTLLESAKIISGAKFFLGNQSVNLAIAEGLKIPRFVETSQDCPNCIPIGYGAHSSWGYEDVVEIIEKYLCH
jgi:hypothetical protein